MNELADAFFAAVASGDIDTIRSIYSPDARIWNNHDNKEKSVDDNINVLRWFNDNVDAFDYDDVRRHTSPTGFAEMHTCRVTLPGQEPLAFPATVIAHVLDGHIIRIGEPDYVPISASGRKACIPTTVHSTKRGASQMQITDATRFHRVAEFHT